MTSSSKSTLTLVAAFLIVLIAVALASFYVWQEMGVIALGFHGWLAVSLGSLGSIILTPKHLHLFFLCSFLDS